MEKQNWAVARIPGRKRSKGHCVGDDLESLFGLDFGGLDRPLLARILVQVEISRSAWDSQPEEPDEESDEEPDEEVSMSSRHFGRLVRTPSSVIRSVVSGTRPTNSKRSR